MARPGANGASESAGLPPAGDDEPPNWPDETAEAAFLADARAQGVSVAAASDDGDGEPAKTGALPALEELVQRVPAEVREALDELFRARFVTVKRVPKKALK